MKTLALKILACLVAGALLAACVTSPVQEARKSFDEGRGEESLAMLERMMKQDPANYAARNEYFRQRELLTARWLGQAETLRIAGQLEPAEALYRLVQKYDPQSVRARAGLALVETERRHRKIVASAEQLARQQKFAEAQDLLRPVLVENPGQRDARRVKRLIEERTARPAVITPRLKAASLQPFTLELRDVTLRSVFDVISRSAGINFVFDRDARTDQRTSIAVRDTPVEELIRLVLSTNQLEQKIVNETTVVVFPNTPQKLREYQDLVVKSFYLANADAKQTANMIRTLVKTRDIFVDEKLNLIVIKDTPSAIRLAERLITAQDIAEPEVMLEVEVLEVASNKLLEIGLRFPDSVAWSLMGAGGTPGVVTLPEWLNRGAELVQLSFTNPLFLLTLRQTDGTTSVLSNPRIRVINREKAKIHIGEKLPVITTTAAATGGFVSESVSYLDVGLKLEVEPLVYLEDEVGIKLGLEVSNVVREIKGAGTGTLTYQIGTRNANTVLRLKDGETQILAGLISDDDRRTASRVPGVGEMPVVGRLFSATKDTTTKSEIVLLITPRILRTLARPDARSMEFAAGTDISAGAAAAPLGAPPPPAVIPPPSPARPPAQPGPGMKPFGGVKQ